MEKSLILIKPDAVCKKVMGEIISQFERENLKIVALKMIFLDKEKAEGFYKVHKGKYFFDELIRFMNTAPSCAMVIEGENAVLKSREIIGARIPNEAKQGTIRQKFGSDGRRNIVHASDSLENAEIEINFFFTKKEIYSYNEIDWLNSTPG